MIALDGEGLCLHTVQHSISIGIGCDLLGRLWQLSAAAAVSKSGERNGPAIEGKGATRYRNYH